MRPINQVGLDLIKEFESCKLQAYQDQRGVWTIGWGHTGPEVVQGMAMTQEQADATLQKDLEQKAYPIDENLSDTINENQYAAICSLCYNVGITAVRKSKTLKLINEGEDPTQEWLGFCHTNGEVNEGLLRRRKAELTLYFKLD